MTVSEKLTFMAVHAHPDDEVFGTGGSFARLASEGVRTVLVTSTLGECGEIVDPALDDAAKNAMFPRLAEVRIEELKASTTILNVSEQRFLGYRDSGMAGTEDNQNPASFHRAVIDEAVKKLVGYIRELQPQVIATYDHYGSYGHPDHIQAHRVTRLAFAVAGDKRFYEDLGLEPWQPSKLYFSAIPRSAFQKIAREMREAGIEGPWNNPKMEVENWGTPDELLTTRFDVRDFVTQKMNAFRAHKTQIAPDNFVFIIPESKQREVWGYEAFTLTETRNLPPTYTPGNLEEDLFAGFR